MNLGSDDNRFFFFLEGWVGGRCFGGRRKKQMKWQGKKWAVWSATSERAPVGWNAGSSKNFEISPLPSYTHPRLPGFELGRMLSVTFQKWERRRGTVHLSETLVFSLYGETYPAEHITISARDNIGNSMYPLYLPVWVLQGHKER